MEGDPAIRWQVLRDLLDAKESDWQSERAKVGTGNDWASRFLCLQDEAGTWGGGIYSPKWTSTTYTLLTLIDCGLISENPQAKRGADCILDSLVLENGNLKDLKRWDLCVIGFYLHIGSVFLPRDERLPALLSHVLTRQLADGGWNCRADRLRNVKHSSFHTTFNVLEGLRAAAGSGIVDQQTVREAESKAIEFMLAHQLYRSDKTGEAINENFTMISFPVRWHYDILRGLDYIRTLSQIQDERLQDPLQVLQSKKSPKGLWPIQQKHAGETFFNMEGGRESRWNTLRALRVLKQAKHP